MSELRDHAEVLLSRIQEVILGKEQEVREVFLALAAGGNVLLEDIPGVGKTTLALCLAKLIDLDYKRVQFTPDVMPSDLTGFSVYRPQDGTFVYQKELHPMDIPVHYVDENGEAIAKDTAQTVAPGSGTVLPMGGVSPEDYELISPAAVEVMLDENGAHPAEVTFQYRRVIKAASVVLHYVDDLGNPIAEDTVASVPGGDSLVGPMANIDPTRYALMEPLSYPVTVTLEGASASELTFAYQRLVQPVTVTIHYVDERGEIIAPDSQPVFGEGEHEVKPLV